MDTQNTRQVVVQANQLTKHFGDFTAVDAVSFSIHAGEVVGYLGPNGSGKTTTIRMLLGLIKPDSGEVKLFGKAVRENRLALAKRVGALVETPSLYAHLNGRENLEVTRRLAGNEQSDINSALKIAGLEKASHRRVGTYSLGMKQRLAIALAILSKPELLILDEPTNGLDPAGILEIRELIKRLPQEFGISVFISSHLLNEVEQVAGYIAIIQSGRLKFQGTLKELQSQKQSRILIKVDKADRAEHILSEFGYDTTFHQHHISVSTSATDEAAALINMRLVEQGIKVYHLAFEQPSLEDLFLNLTSGTEEIQT